MQRRNTTAFTFLAWGSFILSFAFLIVGIWNADWSLVEKGFYAGSFIWGIFSAFVLAKVVRDNDEDKYREINEYRDKDKDND